MAVHKWEAELNGRFAMTGRGDGTVRVASYCRVSTDDQESSYEAQKKHFMDLLQQHPEWRFVRIYADEGISGTSTARRKEFLQMLRDCENGEIDLIVTKSVSRFARNTVDMLLAVRKLRELHVNVIFEKENLDTRDVANELFLTFWASFAQAESISISKNVLVALRGRMERGEGRINCRVSIGYSNTNGSIDMYIVPEEAVLVRRIYREYLEGFSENRISEHLTSDKIPSPKGGEKWFGSTIAYMLQNQMYMGDLLFQKTYTEDTLMHKVAQNKGQLPQYYLQNHHEPEIPEKVFFLAQGERMRRAAQRCTKNQEKSCRDPFRGRLICGICGRTLRKVVFPDGTAQWRCKRRALNKKTYSKENRQVCECPWMSENILREAFLLALAKLPAHRDEIHELIRLSEESETKEHRDIRRRLQQYEGISCEKEIYLEKILLNTEIAEEERKRLHLRNLLNVADCIGGMKAKENISAGTGALEDRTDSKCVDTGAACRTAEEFYQLTDRTEVFSLISLKTWEEIAAYADVGLDIYGPCRYLHGDLTDDTTGHASDDPTALLSKSFRELVSDTMLHRFVEKMTVYPDGVKVGFNGGLAIMIRFNAADEFAGHLRLH